MTLAQAVFLFCMALIGGTLNAVVGGGSFITFPALLATGMPGIDANATNTVALWPGLVATISAYRRSLTASRRTLLTLGIVSALGGWLGAWLLIRTQSTTFEILIPWLLLVATLLFSFGNRLTAALRSRSSRTSLPRWLVVGTTLLLQFAISVYGGFFGAGIGILMLAVLAMLGMEHIHEMNALRTVLAASINGIAVLTFILAHVVAWPQMLVMMVGAMVGGYGSAYYVRTMDPKRVRLVVLLIAYGVTIYFFVRTFA